MIRFTLTEEDRAVLDAPEVLEYDPSRPKLKELRELERQCGVTYDALGDGLSSGDMLSLARVVWMALLRAGVTVRWEDLDLDLLGITYEVDEESPKAQKPKK
ncbi:hypothetical protein [Micromonospora sp. NPDC049891]|uniref:hypothetical protein n=1 Tax=Micromonospora sp. NPDC049891 TaxID=3155655 RepID=UPI0033E81119